MMLVTLSLLVLLATVGCQGKIASLQDSDSSAEEYNRYQEASKGYAQLVRNAGPGFRVKVISNDRPPDLKEHVSFAAKGARSDIAIRTVENEDKPSPSPIGHSSSDIQRFVSVMHSIVFVWSPWSEWTTCSRTCGGGVSSRKRTCRREYARVTPGSGIRTSHDKCIGDSIEYKSCATQPCAVLVDTFNTNQCSAYNGRTIGGITVQKWVPYAGGTNPCELACLAEGKNFYYTFGKVADGTPCLLDMKSSGKNVCVNGRCSPVGCDGKVNAFTSLDMCGVCGGSNSTCTKVAAVVFTDVPASDSPVGGTQDVSQAPSQYGYNLVVRVPRHATHVKIVDNSTNYLAVLDGKTRKYVFNGDWVIDWPGNYEAGGTRFEYNRQKDHSESLSADGPVEHDVVIMLLQRAKNPGVYYEYWIPKEKSKAAEFRRHRPQPILNADRQVAKKEEPKPPKIPKTTWVPPTTPPTTQVFRATPSTTTPIPKSTPSTKAPPLPTAASLIRKSGARKMYYTYGNSTYQKFPIVKNKLLLPKKTKKSHSISTNEISPDAWSATWILEDKEWQKKSVKGKGVENKRKKVKKNKEDEYCSFSCRRKQSARKHFCSKDFAIKAKVLHYDVIKDEIRYEVQLLQSYKNTLPMLSREYVWAAGAKCLCPRLKVGHEYIMLGTADKAFRKNEARFYLSSDSYVRPFNRANLERILRLRRDEVRYCSKYKD